MEKAGKNGAQSPGTVAILPAEYFYELIKKNNMIVIQSFNDIITNSSSELFVSDTSLSEEEIISFLSKVSYGYLKPVKFNLKEYRNWRGTNTPSDIFETVEGWFSDPENENDIIDYYLRRLAWEDIPKKFMKKFNRLLSSLKIPSCVCPTELNDIEEIRKFLLSEPVPECMKIADKDNAELLDGKWLVLSEYDNSMPSITFDFIEKILNANRYHLG